MEQTRPHGAHNQLMHRISSGQAGGTKPNCPEICTNMSNQHNVIQRGRDWPKAQPSLETTPQHRFMAGAHRHRRHVVNSITLVQSEQYHTCSECKAYDASASGAGHAPSGSKPPKSEQPPRRVSRQKAAIAAIWSPRIPQTRRVTLAIGAYESGI